jgi:uncharacterized protein (DUF2384 family)
MKHLLLSAAFFLTLSQSAFAQENENTEDKFNKWMFKKNRALGEKSPYEVCDNQFGREEVKNIIGRIDYGVYS